MTEPFVSYAQHGEDVILWRALGGDSPRFYVDVGAFDPTDDSVTRALYERGWRGINIEPQRDRIALFDRDRPEDINLCLAVGAEDRTAILHVPPTGAPWATLDDRAAEGFRAAGVGVEDRPVEVRTLASVLAERAIAHVDVLKIDVEGGEPDVIRGLDLERVRPTVIVVEGYAPHVERAAGDAAVELLVAAGYTHCLFDGLNHYLTCDPALVDALSLPANPTDGYITAPAAAIGRYESERRDLLTTIERLTARPPEPPTIDEVMAAYPAVS